jgi:transcriptional regulator GlxA family with amidase domain
MIENDPGAKLTLDHLALQSKLSPYHFLRTFQQLTGLTPHQYVRRARLREAAVRLSTQRAKVLEIALDCGFGDVSNFNRAFRNEFGENPRQLKSEGH